MTTCSNCGLAAMPTDRYCQSCGQQLDVKDAESAPVAGVASAASASAGSASADIAAYPQADPLPAASAAGSWPAAGSSSSNASSPPADASTDASAARKEPMPGRLIVRSPGVAEPREYALDGGNIAIGRSPSCDVVLEGDQLTSRRHALLRYDGARYTIVDLGSSNGTFVNGAEIHEARPLADGDRILVGEHELLYSTDPTTAAAALAGRPSDVVRAAAPPPRTDPYLAAVGDEPDAPTRAQAAPTPAAPASNIAEITSPLTSGAELAVAGDQDDQLETAMTPVVADVAPPAPAISWNGSANGSAAPAVPASEVETIHAELSRLSQATDALARRAEEAERLAEQRRAALAETRDRLTTLVEEQQRITPEVEDDNDDLGTLIRVTRLAADNPRHLDYVMQLSEHSGELLSVLEARQARSGAPSALLAELSALRAWLARLT